MLEKPGLFPFLAIVFGCFASLGARVVFFLTARCGPTCLLRRHLGRYDVDLVLFAFRDQLPSARLAAPVLCSILFTRATPPPATTPQVTPSGVSRHGTYAETPWVVASTTKSR